MIYVFSRFYQQTQTALQLRCNVNSSAGKVVNQMIYMLRRFYLETQTAEM